MCSQFFCKDVTWNRQQMTIFMRISMNPFCGDSLKFSFIKLLRAESRSTNWLSQMHRLEPIHALWTRVPLLLKQFFGVEHVVGSKLKLSKRTHEIGRRWLRLGIDWRDDRLTTQWHLSHIWNVLGHGVGQLASPRINRDYAVYHILAKWCCSSRILLKRLLSL